MPSAGTRHDFSPVGHGGKSWVTSVGGLPPMIRDICHALLRSGHSESDAIALAVSAVKRWASGQGKVHPDTRAKAAAAVAQWEAMKAASHVKSAVKASGGKRSAVDGIASLLGDSGYRNWAKWNLEHPYVDKGRTHGVSEGAWLHLTQDEALEHDVAKSVGNGASPDGARRLAEMMQQGGRGDDVWARSNGSTVSFGAKAKTTDKQKKIVADTLAHLNNLYPKGAPSASVVDPNIAVALSHSRGVFGMTRRGGAHMVLSAKAVKPAGQKSFDGGTERGHTMPAGKGHTVAEYTVTHEFGHMMDTPNGKPRLPETQRLLDDAMKNGGGSAYGRTSDIEMYAEMFAEYHLSGGTTTDVTAQALAKSEGWKA